MQWIVFCLIAAFVFSISVFIDNYLTDVIFKGRTPQAIKAIDCVLYVVLAIIIAAVFGIESAPLPIIVLALASGMITSFSSIFYYLALRDEEATTASIFFQVIPVLCIIADFVILGHSITIQQICGFILVLLAPIIITIARRHKKSRKLELKVFGFFMLYVILHTIGNIGYAKAEQYNPDAMTLFFWFIVGRAIFDTICTFFIPKFRKRLKQVIKKDGAKFVLLATTTLGLTALGDFLVRYSYNFTTTSLATALSNASELIVTFILGIILTIIWPKFGREKLNRHIVISHLIAVILIVIGIILAN